MSSAWQESFWARCQFHLSHRLVDLLPYSFSRFCVSFEYSRSLWLCALVICKFEDFDLCWARNHLPKSRMQLTDFKVLTFDCYGTLIDWENGITKALQPLLVQSGKT